MAHLHSVYDTDAHFSINAATRALKNESSAKNMVIQHDHNSERFTFEIPRYIEGHDMSLCNGTEIHYLNIDAKTKARNAGIYLVDDLQISPNSEDVVVLSWLVSGNATEYAGSLNFLIRFVCNNDDGSVEYAWSTGVCTGISVTSGIYNSGVIIAEYADILEQWKSEIIESLNDSIGADPTLTEIGKAAEARATGDAVARLSTEIKVERLRITNLSTLPDGSTTGDAELHDIRVGADGVVHSSAGESVREQFRNVSYVIQGLERADDELKIDLANKIDGAYADEDGYLYLTSNGDVLVGPIGPFAGGSGGGSGSGNNATLTVTNTTGWISNTISDKEDCNVSFNWTSVEGESPTGSGTVNIKVNGASKVTKNIEQGDVTINIKDYLAAGSNVVRITVSDVYGNVKTLSLNISVVSFLLTSTFNDSTVYSADVTFPYTPTGSTTKTMYFLLDGEEIGIAEVTASGRQQNFTIPMQSHGSHTFEVYFTALVNESEVESNRLYYDIIFAEEGNATPIIAASFNAEEMNQFYSVNIPYVVYTPSSITSAVTLKANGKVVQNLTVDRTKQNWTYRADEVGDLELEIATGDVKKTINLTVKESGIDVSAETNDLELYLSSYGRSNGEENPATWTYGDIEAEFEGFNFVSDGWQQDNDGNTVLRLSGDARLTIPLDIFKDDFRSTGKTIEFEFATRDVLNYDTEIISCMSGGKGLTFTAQKSTLKSEQSEVFVPYKEDEHVRISYVIEKMAESRLILVYVDGIISRIIQYPDTEDIQQTAPVGLSIGSSECTPDLYCIRVYKNNLNRYQMLDNWIADTQNGYDMLNRYDHNNIYDEYGQVVISALPSNLPYLVLEAKELPQYKGDKKTVSGYYVDPLNNKKSFTFNVAEADVQGTSSQYYKRKNYKIKFYEGFKMSNGSVEDNYKMRDDSIPTNTFTFKADVASSEGANNVELARLYNDICPYKTPAQEENELVRQGIDGFPIVVFWNNGSETIFLGKYNFNNDKATEEVFGFNAGDESWEILNNTSDRSLFKSDDFSGSDWKSDFEGRFPDKNTDVTELQKLSTWLVSTDQTQATGNALSPSVTYEGVTYTNDTAAYRLAKFKAEAEDWLELDAWIFNYIFTEMFLMVDSRAKNLFPTRYEGGKWIPLPYDYDTAIGINNEGLLVFDYSLEDTDTVNGSNVYNGQDSVLYINLREAFADEIEEMYKDLRSEGKLAYADVEQRFEDHQNKWPESIFNEDAYYKYIQPLVDDGEATYLSMAQGSKESQRKWWLYNRFRYIDSKYTTGDALSNTITLRCYQKSDFNITPYADIYACAAFDSTRVKERAHRNEETEILSPSFWNPNGSDAVVNVYSANELKDIGDLAPFKVGYADFSKATKLQRIKVGDSASTYSNGNMTELYVGNNTLLKTVDVRNCPNLTATVDLSGCINLEEAYFDGTATTGVSFANGAAIKTLHLPSTVTNLTLRNTTKLTDFVLPSYANITTLRLENVPSVVDSLAILNAIPSASRVRLIGFDWTFDSAGEITTLCNRLDTMRGLDANNGNVDKAQVSGTVRVNVIGGSTLAEIQARYPDMNVVYGSLANEVRFYDYDGTLLYTDSVSDGGNGKYGGATPKRETTAQYSYAFAGWSLTQNGSVDANALLNITEDRSVYAVYNATVRTYTIRFYNDSTLLQTSTVAYGEMPIYAGATPSNGEDYMFTGWSPALTSVTGNADYYAQFKEKPNYSSIRLVDRTIKSYSSDTLTKVGDQAFCGCTALKSVNLPNVTQVMHVAFNGCTSLTIVELPKVTLCGDNSFGGCKALTEICLPSAAHLSNYNFYDCTALTTVDLGNPSLSSMLLAGSPFYSCGKLKTLILRSNVVATMSSSTALNSTRIASGSGYIYVPRELLSDDDATKDYRRATNWIKYANQFRALEDYTVDGTTTGALDASKI